MTIPTFFLFRKRRPQPLGRTLRHWQWFAGMFLVAVFSLSAQTEKTIKPSAIAFGGKRTDFQVNGHAAFVIVPTNSLPSARTPLPWIWYAPTFAGRLPSPEHQWLFSRLVAAGFAIAGIDVGESYGNPAGRKAFSSFHLKATARFNLSVKACLFPQSRGGLMLYNWAAENPEKVKCVAGIYTVCNLVSYPGLEKAAPAFGIKPDELARDLSNHNPIDRLQPLAKARVRIFHIHGDADTIVPLETNAGELVKRYRALGAPADLVVIPGKGHEVVPEFFESPALLNFLLSHRATKPHAARKQFGK